MVRRRRRVMDGQPADVDLGLSRLLNGERPASFEQPSAPNQLVEIGSSLEEENKLPSQYEILVSKSAWEELCALSESEMEKAAPKSVALLEARLWWIKGQFALGGIPVGILVAPLMAVSRGLIDLDDSQRQLAKRRGIVAVAIEQNRAISELLRVKGDLEGVEALNSLRQALEGVERGEGNVNFSQNGADQELAFDKPASLPNRKVAAIEPVSSSFRNLGMIVFFALALAAGFGVFLYQIGRSDDSAESVVAVIAEEPLALSQQSEMKLDLPRLSRDQSVELEQPLSATSQDVEPEEVLVVEAKLPQLKEVTTDNQGENIALDGSGSDGSASTEQAQESEIVQRELLAPPSEKEAGPSKERHYRIIARTYVRADPSFSSPPLDTLFNGDRVVVVGREGGWFRLRSVKGRTGFIVVDDAVPLERPAS